ncbi:Hypothetical protein SMAX5B_003620 [Scophthalmus maximus]|uniref:Uncharacterized protein n=1 Tax=Scophthalmus maximus TaxID=52904 RepID=A0A2U9CHX3_SCOMX|nr:Hypothetical protein SMAX5B_003620 [Scophthalmus maximus]
MGLDAELECRASEADSSVFGAMREQPLGASAVQLEGGHGGDFMVAEEKQGCSIRGKLKGCQMTGSKRKQLKTRFHRRNYTQELGTEGGALCVSTAGCGV